MAPYGLLVSLPGTLMNFHLPCRWKCFSVNQANNLSLIWGCLCVGVAGSLDESQTPRAIPEGQTVLVLTLTIADMKTATTLGGGEQVSAVNTVLAKAAMIGQLAAMC